MSGRLAGTPQCVGECRVSPASQGDQARGHQRRAGARTAAGLGGVGRGAARRPRGCRSRSVSVRRPGGAVPVTLRACVWTLPAPRSLCEDSEWYVFDLRLFHLYRENRARGGVRDATVSGVCTRRTGRGRNRHRQGRDYATYCPLILRDPRQNLGRVTPT